MSKPLVTFEPVKILQNPEDNILHSHKEFSGKTAATLEAKKNGFNFILSRSYSSMAGKRKSVLTIELTEVM